MNEALEFFSRKGELKSTVSARDIKSREDARKKFPLVTPTLPLQLVTWVSPSFENGKLRRRSHFRVVPGSHRQGVIQHVKQEESERQHAIQESKAHRQAKDMIAAELSRRLRSKLAMPWCFKDEGASDFHLTGNLLLGASVISTEHTVKTPFGYDYRLDVAVLAPPVNQGPMILGGIEIELGHAFEGRKALIAKSQGFPLISIDITQMTLADITPEWAEHALTATTRSNEQGRRSTYIYLHDLLYPLYVQLPDFIDKERRHQFLVFAKDEELVKMMGWLKKLSEKLHLPKNTVTLAFVNAKSDQSQKMLENAGDVIGSGWREVNDHQCLRITVNRPSSQVDEGVNLFHIAMARLLLSHIDALVGYKYKNGILNDDSTEDIWVHHKWDAYKKTFERHRVLPKRLAEPASRLIEVLRGLGAD